MATADATTRKLTAVAVEAATAANGGTALL